MGCQVRTCNWKGYKTPFHRPGHILSVKELEASIIIIAMITEILNIKH